MRKLLLLLIFISASLLTNAQSKQYPWAVGAGVNFPDFLGAKSSFGNYLTDAYWQNKGLPLRISLGRNISSSFNVEASFNMVELDNIGEPIVNENFFDVDLTIHYKFANGYLLKETSWFDPYIYAGVEYVSYNDIDQKFAALYGIGINAWITKNVGVYGQGAYDLIFSGPGYYHFAFGLKYRFNPAKDRDKDGIKDRVDECPDTPGLPEFNGCPDTDGDGIEDRVDHCPTVPGIPEFKGCPDSDGDGIPDKDDLCPDVPGLAEFNGCPDTDGDGIADKDDLCPLVAGPKETRGCPDTDGDGIADADDQCPNEAGPASNNGCPLPPPPPVFEFPEVIINYETAKYGVPASYDARLNEAAKMMIDHPEVVFTVYGHTDTKGNDEFNMTLSENRANKVAEYLKKKGVPATQLEVKGFGKARPKASNDTPEGMAENRRVEIKKR